MKKIFTAVLVLLIGSPLFSQSSDSYRKAAREIIDACVKSNIRSLALLPFENKNKAPEEQLSYSFEKLLSELQNQDKVFVFENTISDLQAEKNKIEGIVLVKAFADEKDLKVIIKLIRASDGLVLKTGEGSLQSKQFSPPQSKDKFSLSNISPEIPEYRDAVKDFNEQDCRERYARIYSKQEELLEAKAKFWAEKLNSPNFSLSSLRRNPGSEIKSQFLKQQFYAMLEEYKKSGQTALSEEEKKKLKELFTQERAYVDDCGI